jgi:HEAT repeat protein
MQALKDHDGWVRKSAAEALGRIGPAAKDAVPALNELLKDEFKEVRAAAQAALKKIQAAPPAPPGN